MTYRFGRTSKLRYAATMAGVSAYTFAGAPGASTICDDSKKDAKGNCPGDPLYDEIVIPPKKKASSHALPKRMKKAVPKRVRKRRRPRRARRRVRRG